MLSTIAHQTCLYLIGTVHFLWGRGAGGIWGGAMRKNLASKGGGSQIIMVCKGGVIKNNAFKFSSDSICSKANNSARRPKIAFLRFWKFKFSRGKMPPDPPTLLYTQRQLYPTNCFITTVSSTANNSVQNNAFNRQELSVYVLQNKALLFCFCRAWLTV